MKLLHQLYAKLFGYFWLPCPKCGAMFGGHQVELGGAHVIVTEGDSMHCYCVCPACDTEEFRAENEAEQQQRIGALMSAMLNGVITCHGITLPPSIEGGCRNTPQSNDGLAGGGPTQ